jgi:hypothetical protein
MSFDLNGHDPAQLFHPKRTGFGKEPCFYRKIEEKYLFLAGIKIRQNPIQTLLLLHFIVF